MKQILNTFSSIDNHLRPFDPVLSKSVPEAAKPLSSDNRGMKIIFVLIIFDVDLLVFFHTPCGFKYNLFGPRGIQISSDNTRKNLSVHY